MRVDGQPCERTALADSVTLGGKRDVERAGLRLPHLLHLKSAAIILPAHLAAAPEASAFTVLWRGHDEDEVVNPRCNVYRLRQASKETSHCTDDAAERVPAVSWPNWQAANLKTKPSIKSPLKSLSQPPRHDDGVHPLTSASTQVTSLGWPGPRDVMMGRRIGRSSPPHPAQSARW